MFNTIKSKFDQNTLKRKLLAFLDEMEKNLEIYYVMDQRQFVIHGFVMNLWEQVKDLDIIRKQEIIITYAQALLEFNKAFKENKDYEQWYSSDMKNKNNENAKKLHVLKDGLNQRVRTLEAIIIPAGQVLEKELLNLGFISP